MTELPAKRPRAALRALAETLAGDAVARSADGGVNLVIRIDDAGLVARDLGAFLQFVDHVYGRSASQDFRSYALGSEGHFAFATTRRGSWELVAQHAAGAYGSLEPVIILWLVLRYLPAAIRSSASTFNQVEQGRLARARRRQIAKAMEEDRDLGTLPQEQRAELARLVDAVVEKEHGLLPRVRRFVTRSFLEVRIEENRADGE